MFIKQYQYGVPERRLALNFNIDRNTVSRWLHRWGIKYSKFIERQERQKRNIKQCDEYGNVWAEGIDMEKLTMLIKADLTIPQIAEQFPEYTYEQVYGSILRDRKLNPLYRKHGQKKIKKHK